MVSRVSQSYLPKEGPSTALQTLQTGKVNQHGPSAGQQRRHQSLQSKRRTLEVSQQESLQSPNLRILKLQCLTVLTLSLGRPTSCTSSLFRLKWSKPWFSATQETVSLSWFSFREKPKEASTSELTFWTGLFIAICNETKRYNVCIAL